jgi:hypothetical protein
MREEKRRERRQPFMHGEKGGGLTVTKKNKRRRNENQIRLD